jgi:hypothetical protein
MLGTIDTLRRENDELKTQAAQAAVATAAVPQTAAAVAVVAAVEGTAIKQEIHLEDNLEEMLFFSDENDKARAELARSEHEVGRLQGVNMRLSNALAEAERAATDMAARQTAINGQRAKVAAAAAANDALKAAARAVDGAEDAPLSPWDKTARRAAASDEQLEALRAELDEMRVENSRLRVQQTVQAQSKYKRAAAVFDRAGDALPARDADRSDFESPGSTPERRPRNGFDLANLPTVRAILNLVGPGPRCRAVRPPVRFVPEFLTHSPRAGRRRASARCDSSRTTSRTRTWKPARSGRPAGGSSARGRRTPNHGRTLSAARRVASARRTAAARARCCSG